MAFRGVVTVAVVGLVGLGTWLGGRALAGDAGVVGIGSEAPDFRAAVIGVPGAYKTIADYRDDVILINLWATWCVPCVTEMPSIQRLYDRYRDQGFKVVGIAVDDPPFEQRIAEFVAERGLTFDILHEGSGKVELDYRARGIPATYVIGRDRRIRVLRQGASDWDSPASRAVVEQLLKSPPRAVRPLSR